MDLLMRADYILAEVERLYKENHPNVVEFIKACKDLVEINEIGRKNMEAVDLTQYPEYLRASIKLNQKDMHEAQKKANKRTIEQVHTHCINPDGTKHVWTRVELEKIGLRAVEDEIPTEEVSGGN